MNKITGQVMYMGPHVFFLGLGYSKTYRNGIDEGLYQWIQKCPALGQLFIPVEKVGAVRRELNFDYAHNMRGTTGKHVAFYREVQKWLAQAQQQPKPPGVTLEKTHA
jgi:hypothetical protein